LYAIVCNPCYDKPKIYSNTDYWLSI